MTTDGEIRLVDGQRSRCCSATVWRPEERCTCCGHRTAPEGSTRVVRQTRTLAWALRVAEIPMRMAARGKRPGVKWRT